LFSVLRREEGQGLVEYGLIVFMIALVLVGALTVFSSTITNFYTTIASTFGHL
jgi:pilus assembly protein Flp/PilA